MWMTGGKARDDSQVSVLVTVVASPQRVGSILEKTILGGLPSVRAWRGWWVSGVGGGHTYHSGSGFPLTMSVSSGLTEWGCPQGPRHMEELQERWLCTATSPPFPEKNKEMGRSH